MTLISLYCVIDYRTNIPNSDILKCEEMCALESRKYGTSSKQTSLIEYLPLRSICSRPSVCSLAEKESLLFLPPLKMPTKYFNCCFNN